MRSIRLERFRAPPPPPRPAPASCASCKTFAPEVLVPDPDTDGACAMCWICAHHVVEHNVEVASAFAGRCKCPREKIYPADVPRAYIATS